MRAYAAAKAGMSYTEIHDVHTDQRLKTASKVICDWKRKGNDTYVDRGFVDSLDAFIFFFFKSDDRLRVMTRFFQPPHWGPDFFKFIGHTGPDPLTKAHRDRIKRMCEF
jgi:hypothetical protein